MNTLNSLSKQSGAKQLPYVVQQRVPPCAVPCHLLNFMALQHNLWVNLAIPGCDRNSVQPGIDCRRLFVATDGRPFGAGIFKA